MNKKMSFITKNFIVLGYMFKFCPLYVVFSFIYIIANVILSVSKIYIINEALNQLTNKGNIEHLYKSLLLYIIVIFICILIKTFYNSFLEARYRIVYMKKIQKVLFKKAILADIASFDDPVFFDSFNRGLRDSQWRGFLVYKSFVNFLMNFLRSIAVGTYIVAISPLLIVIVLLSSIINVIVINKTNNLWYKFYRTTESERRFYWYVTRTFYEQKYAAEIKTTSVGDLLIDKYNESAYAIEDKYNNTARKLIIPHSIHSFSHFFLYQGGTYIYLTYQLFSKVLDIAKFSASINATIQFSDAFIMMVNVFLDMKMHSLYIDDFIWIMNYSPKIEIQSGTDNLKDFNNLSLQGLCFSYPDTKELCINDLSMNIKKGEKIAIVGCNGGGKTTLTKMLLKFYEPSSGVITYNGLSYNDIIPKAIRNKYRVVFQDFQIYAVSIAENVLLRYCQTKEDEEKVKVALEKVGLLDKINKYKDGIYTIVSKEFDEKGIVFSGGERQKIAIARMLASDADIYILDEPTSSLDPISEQKINNLIISQSTDKTIIIIAHRLSTVVDLDKIYLIDNGKLIEEGSHQALIKKNGVYAKMFMTQKHLYEQNM